MAPTRRGVDHSARRRARRRAVQALYQSQLGGQAPDVIEAQFLAEYAMAGTDLEYFSALLHGVTAGADDLDAAIEPFLDRPLVTLDPVERAILRLGAYEMLERIDVPYRVVVNEGVELARTFGAEQSHRYINGVLDRVGRHSELRRAELADSKPR